MFALRAYPTVFATLERSGSDYFSGILFGWQEADLKANMDACFPDDAELGKVLGDYLQATKDGKYDDAKKFYDDMQSKLEADLDSCQSDKGLMAAWNTIGQIYEDFIAQEDYEEVMKQNYLDNQVAIDGYAAQMFLAWDAEMYYQAGKLGGLIDGYLFAQ